MLPTFALPDKFFRWLVTIDEETSRRVARAGCQRCGGPLHRGDYARKPRGGLLAVAGEVFTRRISLCCGWPGCRRRSTPPSLLFLGRRVYLGVVVLLAAMAALTPTSSRALRRATGVPVRTVRRWGAWWQSDFIETRLYQEERARFMPPLSIEALPTSLVARFEHADRQADEALVRTLAFLSPLSTASVIAGSRFMRVE